MTITSTLAKAPGALPLIGHTGQMLRNPLGFMGSLPAHGDIVEIRIGAKPVYVVCHPDLVREMLIHDEVFDKGGAVFELSRQILGNGLGTCPHRDHRRQRRLMQPAFQRGRLPGYTVAMAEQVAGITGRWRDGVVIDVGQVMHAITARAIVSTIFGPGLPDPVITKFLSGVDTINRLAFLSVTLPSWTMDLLNRRAAKTRAALDAVIGQLVERRRTTDPDREDLLSTLLSARDENDGSLSDIEIGDQIITMIVAGTDTAAAVLSWAWHLLGAHPDIEARLHAEVDAVLAGAATAGWDDLPRLDLTRRVVLETLRLYPPGWISTRTATSRTQLATMRIPSGTTLAYSPYELSRRSDLYPEPQRFDPDRWPRTSTIHQLPHMPFGWGARRCIGDAFATIEATIVLASIAAHWRLLPLCDTVRRAPLFILHPHHLRMRIHQRIPQPFT
ncbi:cytochrome P450 [Nocardia suismassiliense]|uniref:Cytochrome P450 n=1 Tax=Nocardia suismassiliense TaxID=2077092 RepID=A0ABW6R7X4_9NOCA